MKRMMMQSCGWNQKWLQHSRNNDNNCVCTLEGIWPAAGEIKLLQCNGGEWQWNANPNATCYWVCDSYGWCHREPVNKPEATAMVIIARWPQVSHSYSTYSRWHDITNDLLHCDWLDRKGLIITRAVCHLAIETFGMIIGDMICCSCAWTSCV